MAVPSMPIWLLPLLSMIVQSFGNLDDSFSAHDLLQNSTYRSHILFHGDASASENKSAVQLSNSGWIEYNEPVSFAEGHGFSSYFKFSVSYGVGGSLTFFISPIGFNANVYEANHYGSSHDSGKKIPLFVAVEFHLTEDAKHVGIDVGRFISVKSRNFSFAEGDLTGEKKLHSWIDYQASYKKLEVRLSDSNSVKPVGPLISFPVDLSGMWSNETRVLSLGSYRGKSSSACFVYSWTVRKVAASPLMHSVPFDPNGTLSQEGLRSEKEKYCVLRLVALLLLGFSCGVAAALSVVYARTLFGDSRAVVSVVPEECALKHVRLAYKNANDVIKLDAKQ